MAATVDIIIKGVAICYRRNDLWKVLFPTDHCHTIKFTYKKGDDPESEPRALSTSTRPIVVAAPRAAEPELFETPNFKASVFDLTSRALRTHPRIKKKALPGPFVLMTIEKACFSVDRYLHDFSDPVPDLVEKDTENKTPIHSIPIAHSVKATIKGGIVTVDSSVLSRPFSTDNEGLWTLIFDNDCKEIRAGKNDMDMFYQIIEEDDDAPGGKRGRQFRIGKAGRNTSLRVEPPDYEEGKPCLVGKVTDEESIRTLP